MRIIVLMKEVPDTYEERGLDLETGLADRDPGSVVLDEIDERALEVAVCYAELNSDVEITVVTMAPETAEASLRRALAIGAAKAVHVTDEALRGADLGLTAKVLSATCSHIGFDLIVTGNL